MKRRTVLLPLSRSYLCLGNIATMSLLCNLIDDFIISSDLYAREMLYTLHPNEDLALAVLAGSLTL